MKQHMAEVLSKILKYLLEGIAVGLATYFVSAGKLTMTEIIIIAIIASAVFGILDMYSPQLPAADNKS